MLPAKQKTQTLYLVSAGILLLIVALLIVLSYSWIGKAPPQVLVMSVKSPDGRYTASEYSADLGAVGGNTYIRIKPTADSFSKGDMIVVDTTAHIILPPSWNGSRTLVVGVYDAEDQLTLHKTVWHDVRVVYQKRKYPSE